MRNAICAVAVLILTACSGAGSPTSPGNVTSSIAPVGGPATKVGKTGEDTTCPIECPPDPGPPETVCPTDCSHIQPVHEALVNIWAVSAQEVGRPKIAHAHFRAFGNRYFETGEDGHVAVNLPAGSGLTQLWTEAAGYISRYTPFVVDDINGSVPGMEIEFFKFIPFGPYNPRQ